MHAIYVGMKRMNKQELAKYREVCQFVKTHCCAVCGKRLNYYDGQSDQYKIVCMRDRSHQGFVRIPEPRDPSYTELYNTGVAIPGEIRQQIERRARRNMEQQYGTDKAKALEPYRRATSLTEDQAKYILQTIWPKAPLVEVTKAALLCRDFQLNPLMKHVFLIPFKTKAGGVDWVTVLGINATRTLARRVNPYGYADGPRMMSESEQERIFGKVDKEHVWAITVVEDARGLKAPGYGSWPKGTLPYGADKGNTAENMAMIRSERAALQRLCPAEMGEGFADFDITDERFISIPNGTERRVGLPPEPAQAEVEAEAPTATTEEQKQAEKREDAWNRDRIKLSVRNMKWSAAKISSYLQDRCKDKSIKTVEDIPSDKLHAIATELADWESMS